MILAVVTVVAITGPATAKPDWKGDARVQPEAYAWLNPFRPSDVYFQPPKKGALPAEEGLDLGANKQNVWATGRAFNERLTRIHLSRDWFEGEHPTYVMND